MTQPFRRMVWRVIDFLKKWNIFFNKFISLEFFQCIKCFYGPGVQITQVCLRWFNIKFKKLWTQFSEFQEPEGRKYIQIRNIQTRISYNTSDIRSQMKKCKRDIAYASILWLESFLAENTKKEIPFFGLRVWTIRWKGKWNYSRASFLAGFFC